MVLREIVLILSLAYAVNAQCSMSNPCTPLKGGDDFEKPIQIASSYGSLITQLNVDAHEFTLDWLTVKRRLYNGRYTGPTIRIKASDSIQLTLTNNLQGPDFDAAAMNEFRYPNTTNLHTHGLHISSQEPQDNPFVRVGPGEQYTYSYQIHPQQPAGTYWYHPHTHGSVHFQILSGMSGMLIVEDDSTLPENSALSAVSCPENCDKEVQIVFQSFQYADDDDAAFTAFQKDIHDAGSFRLNDVALDGTSASLEEWLENPDNDIRYVLVNGQLQPKMEMKAAELRRFRFVNAIGVHALALSIEDDEGNQCDVREIAIDGVYLPEPRVPRFGRSLVVSGGRLDWLVICDKPGAYKMKSRFEQEYFDSMADHPVYERVLMSIDVIGDVMPTVLPPLPAFLDDLREVSEDQVDGRFTVEVTPTDTMGREDFSGVYYRTKSRVNQIQEWNFINTEFATSHPIHMHINHMQVVSYNKYRGPVGVDDGDGNWKMYSITGDTCQYQHPLYDDSLDIEFPKEEALNYLGHDRRYDQGGKGTFGYAQVGEWRDTLLVPPLSNITVRFRTDSFIGDVMLHCHLTGDEDQGMMMVTGIVGDGEDTTANELSGDAAPGSCMRADYYRNKYSQIFRQFVNNLHDAFNNADD